MLDQLIDDSEQEESVQFLKTRNLLRTSSVCLSGKVCLFWPQQDNHLPVLVYEEPVANTLQLL
jgi:hypothetical protein